MNYVESLKHLYKVGMLNEKGMNELIKILQTENFDLQEKIINIETKNVYRKK